ncbi:MAG: tRNA (N6-isopentenyl adenosine(37)-C2)-methylthiotransferase MiaB [Elusimicrobiota bacterium]
MPKKEVKNIKKSVYIKTFGCQMNKSDSRRLEESFTARGYTVTDKSSEADVVVYNTCSVREHAENKAMSHIGRMKFNKEKNPDVKICVVGCMAQRMGDEIQKRLPHVDIIAGPVSMTMLPDLLKKKEASGVFKDDTELKEYNEHSSGIAFKESGFSRFVPIMRGCDNFCSYCIVPFVRGREKYRKKEDILKECSVLAERGIKEITLLGQAVNSHPEFKQILKAAANIRGLKRLRFLTSYPGYMDKETVDIVRENPVLCNFFHLPVQSGSNNILKKMHRKYSVKYYLDIARYVRKSMPMAGLSTDIIVGFPGESREDFQQTLNLVKELEFDQSFTFKYSARKGTKAAGLKEAIGKEEKKRRLAELNNLCDSSAFKRNKLFVGREVIVFSEGGNFGRTEEYKIVHFNGAKAPEGEEVRVNITEAGPHSLRGIKIEK